MWVIATALASCQQAAEPPTLGEPVAEAAGYPSLHTVPPRPQLSYPVEQRQAIIEGLIADRENARYSNQAVRYRTSLSGLPPPDAPPVAVASPPPDEAANAEAPAPRDQAPERSVIGPEIDSVYEDDDDFDTFLENLARDGAAPRGGTV